MILLRLEPKLSVFHRRGTGAGGGGGAGPLLADDALKEMVLCYEEKSNTESPSEDLDV